MCVFGSRGGGMPMNQPPPISARNPDLSEVSQLPTKKDLVDEDDISEVAYGTGQKEGAQAKKTGAKQLRIPLNTGTQNVASTGGVTGGNTV